MKPANSLISNKVLDGHIYIADPLPKESVATCDSSQFSIPQSDKNATTADDDAAKDTHHGIDYTCLLRAYASGVLLRLSFDGSIIGFILPELFVGPIRYCTYILMLASFSLVVSFVLPSKKFCPIPFQAIIETNLGLGGFVFGFVSAKIVVLLLLGCEFGRYQFWRLALEGLIVLYFAREPVDDVEDAGTLMTWKMLALLKIRSPLVRLRLFR